MKKSYRYYYLDIIAYLLMIVCFPLNPLVLLNIIEPHENRVMSILGSVFWLIGMFLVIYPFIYFRVKGNVPRGKSYVHTNSLVTTGLYSVIRHVQYTGGILAIFVATPLLYPHWIFVILGIPGIILVYLGTGREDQYLIEKFGDEYKRYMEKVPAVNLLKGIMNRIRRTASRK
jgi:protein-S-isoprenylcysteine O-methyltransferase Ste14